MTLQIGESIGHYQIVEEIGAGGNGRVLKVQHLITRRREAMKILANGRPTSQEYAHRVLREIRLQASLDHPNIAAVLNAFWLEDDLVMIMELIDGVTLQQILQRRKLNLEQSLELIRQVLMALSYAHSSGVIHRDISTANIIVTEEGRVKLTDFGLAKGSADLSVTESGGMVGSPYYISPEQVRGAGATDQRSDIYSTGVVLYELITGTRPFDAESTFLLMQAHVQHRAQAPIERNATIPHFINDAILKAMAKNPQDRFQSAAEFLAALEGPAAPVPLPLPEASMQPVAPAPPPPTYSYAAPIPPEPVSPAKAIRKPASPVLAAALGVGIVLAAVVTMAYFNSATTQSGITAPVQVVAPPQSGSDKVIPHAEPMVLNAGPKALPVVPQGNGGLSPRRSGSRRSAQDRAASIPPPKIVVWGDAKSPAPVQAQVPVAPTPAPEVVVPPVRKIEEPPVLAPPTAKAAIEPAMPQTGAVIQRKGLLRRLANGVKALNPVRKDNPVPDAIATKP